MRRSRAALKTRAAELLAPDAPADKMVGSKLQTLGWYAKNQPDVAFYIRAVSRHGGRQGRGDAKKRGSSDYYRVLGAKGLEAQRLKRAALDRSTAALRARREAEKVD